MPSTHRAAAAALVLAGLLAAAPDAALHAQAAGDGFLFRAPSRTLTLHGGYAHANAGSDLFAFTTELLTLGRRDFAGFGIAGDAAFRWTPRLDLVFGAGYAGSRAASEFREWVDADDRPIEQETEFQRVPLSAGVRYYIMPRGRSIGRFAWIPARAVPYVGASAGLVWYRFRQHGDFVDFEDLTIFPDDLESSGWAPLLQASGGLDVTLTPRLGLIGEARYLRASAEPDRSFDGFEPIDLSGVTLTVGVSLRF